MKPAEIHTTKNEAVFSDGEWVSNGYYLVRNEYARLSSKKMQDLINAHIPFSSKEGILSIGDDATIKDLAFVIKGAPEENEETQILQTTLLADIGSGGETARLYRGREHVTLVKTAYQGIVSLGKAYQRQTEYVKIAEAMVAVYNNSGLVALVMPVRTAGRLHKELKQIADLAQTSL